MSTQTSITARNVSTRPLVIGDKTAQEYAFAMRRRFRDEGCTHVLVRARGRLISKLFSAVNLAANEEIVERPSAVRIGKEMAGGGFEVPFAEILVSAAGTPAEPMPAPMPVGSSILVVGEKGVDNYVGGVGTRLAEHASVTLVARGLNCSMAVAAALEAASTDVCTKPTVARLRQEKGPNEGHISVVEIDVARL